MFDFNSLISVVVPFTPDLDPLFVGGFHVIVYEPVLSWGNLRVIEEVNDSNFEGELSFPKSVSQKCKLFC